MTRPRIEKRLCGCRYEHHSPDAYTVTPCKAHLRPSCGICAQVCVDESQTVYHRDERRAVHYACLQREREFLEGFS